jgi:hypothetical protein
VSETPPPNPAPQTGSSSPTPPDGEATREGFIEHFLAWTDSVPAPEVFRLWTAISVVGAIVERRVWMRTGPTNFLFPNLFVFLVGPPGVGKTQAMMPASNLVRKAQITRIAPNDVTKQSLLDVLGETPSILTIPPATIIDYHALYLMIRELSNFMSQYDLALAGILTDLFDCPPENDERKRTNKAGKAIVKPTLSMIAGTATKNLGRTISGDLWGQGFMARVILIHSAEKRLVDIFSYDEDNADIAVHDGIPPTLVHELQQIASMKGPMRWEADAQLAFNTWVAKDCAPAPTHGKLIEYNTRRWLHVTKLSMISALSNGDKTVDLWDFHRAKKWLEDAEKGIPEIFKEMASHSDGEVLRELHRHAWAVYSVKKIVSYEDLAEFLHTRVASRDLDRMIQTAEGVGLLSRNAGTAGTTAKYKPTAKFDYRQEGEEL